MNARPNLLIAACLTAMLASFSYDSRQALDIREAPYETFQGGRVLDITFASPFGGRVAAYLVVPDGSGPFAAILFGHWANGTRQEFLTESKLYAKAGAMSLLPDYPWERPEPWRKLPNHYGQPELDRQIEIQSVVEFRRGLDLLVGRGGVDVTRVGYVGHSFGAQWGAILGAVDRRLKTAILMTGAGSAGDILVRGLEPRIKALRASQPAGQMEAYAEAISALDAIRYIGSVAPVPVFFQFAQKEQYFDAAAMQRYFAAARQPKSIAYYDADHELRSSEAAADRYRWFIQHLGLQRITETPRRGQPQEERPQLEQWFSIFAQNGPPVRTHVTLRSGRGRFQHRVFELPVPLACNSLPSAIPLESTGQWMCTKEERT